MKQFKTHTIWLFVLSLIGLSLAAYLTYLHFAPEASTICQLGEKFDCDVVNKSQYAEFLGIPVAILGAGYYALIALLSGLMSFSNVFAKADLKDVFKGLTLLTTIGLAFTLYLTYVEAFILEAYCIFCLTQQVVILIMWGIFISAYKKASKLKKS